jgi:flavodoxin
MQSLIIFDSNFGNTKKIAEAIAQGIGEDARMITVANFQPHDLTDVQLLIVGSPINGWRPSEKMGKFLASLQDGQLRGYKVAAFDTRVKLFIHGDAASKIAKELTHVGASMVAEPEAFFVQGKEGPLLEGEEGRAKVWGVKLRAKM